MKKIKFLWTPIICIILLGIMAILYVTGCYHLLDDKIYNILISLKSDVATYFFKIVTLGANVYTLIIICLISLLLKNKKYFKFISINAILAFLCNYGLKQIFKRPRPSMLRLSVESGYSFPSGHSMVAIAFYGLIIYFISRSNLKYKKAYYIGLSILILLVGISRIYLGVHYFSDVLCGFLFGTIYLVLFINLIKE